MFQLDLILLKKSIWSDITLILSCDKTVTSPNFSQIFEINFP